MAILFKENNDGKAKSLYAKKIFYDVIVNESEYENLIDFYFAERYLYGRVDNFFLPIIFDTSGMPLATISQTNTEQTGLQAAAFVVQAFNDLNKQFKKKILTGEINQNDEFLSTLEVTKAYQDPRTLYSEYLQKIVEVMSEQVLEQDIKFDNFGQFNMFFDNFVSKMIHEMPLTFSGFIKSKYCPMNVSGLVIEISDQSFANDDEKIKNFKESPNWKFYLNACRSFGFWVDKSNPFRLVANIGSPEMLTYARNTSRCNFTSTFDILSRGYRPAYINDVNSLRNLMFSTYKAVKRPYIKRQICNNSKDNRTIQTIVTPEDFTIEQFTKKYPFNYFLKKYMSIRIKENKLKLKSHQQKKIINDSMSLLSMKGLPKAISSFEKVVAQTYTYSGSLTDLINNVTMDSEQEKQTSQGSSSSLSTSGY
jgi:hypothetical protein